MKRASLACTLMLSLAACGEAPTYNQELRVQLFQDCLKAVPKGPEVSTFNDWNEVVQTCDNISYYQSFNNHSRPREEQPKVVTK